MENIWKILSENMAEATEKAGGATVLVNARRRIPASGIALEKDLILTASHVIEEEEGIQVMLPDGTLSEAELAGNDPGSDLAVLKLGQAIATPAETESDSRVGELVLALGRPSSSGIQASLGVISAKGGAVPTHAGGLIEAHIRTDAIPFPGFSGGPLVNASGKVIAINTSGLGIGSSIAIPIDVAIKIAQILKEHGSVKRGFLGISGQNVAIPAESQKALKRDQASGLLIIDLEPDAPAAVGGIMVGDILVGLGGKMVGDHHQLLMRLAGSLAGEEVVAEVLRGGKPMSLKVILGERPAFFGGAMRRGGPRHGMRMSHGPMPGHHRPRRGGRQEKDKE